MKMRKLLRVILPAFFLFLFVRATAQNVPQLIWAKEFIDSKIEIGSSGNVYISGIFTGTRDFDPDASVFNLTSSGESDIYIGKADAAGNFLWAKKFGGPGNDYLAYFLSDASNNLYVTGSFHGTVDFDPGSGVFNLTSVGNRDVYIAKFDSSGNFLWARQLGGNYNYDAASSLAVDALGNVYITGRFKYTVDFNPGSGTFDLTSAGEEDIFILKLNTSGNFVWANRYGTSGSNYESGNDIEVDLSGNIYTIGNFNGAVDFDPGPGTFILNSTAGSSFLSKLDPSGNFLMAKQGVFGSKLEISSSGNFYTSGSFQGTIDFNPDSGIFNLTSAGGTDRFVLKLDSSCNFLWAKRWGNGEYDNYTSFCLDAMENIYIVGSYFGTYDFDPGPGTYTLSSNGEADAFICKLDSQGDYLWTASFAGPVQTNGYYIKLDASGNIYASGDFDDNTDFDPGTGVFTLNGGLGFLIKLNENLDIRENIFTQNFKIYPNPVSSNLTISSKSSEIEQIKVYDLLGRKILEQIPNRLNVVLNMEKLVSGIYFAEITIHGKTFSRKIAKK